MLPQIKGCFEQVVSVLHQELGNGTRAFAPCSEAPTGVGTPADSSQVLVKAAFGGCVQTL